MYPKHLADEIRLINKEFIAEKEEEAKRFNGTKQNQISVESEGEFLERVIHNSSIDDFSDNAVNKYLKLSHSEYKPKSEEFIKWCLNFGLLVEREEKKLVTNLGMLLFGKNPEHFLPQSIFKIELDYGASNQEIKDLKGPLIEQVTDIWEYIQDKVFRHISDRSRLERTDMSNYPTEIVREVFMNAIIHRDYSISGATNYVYISDKNLLLRSPGAPIKPLTIEMFEILSASPFSRNPKIMLIFSQIKYSEQRGIGFRDFKKLPERGYPLPDFKYINGNIEVTLIRQKGAIDENLNQSEQDLLVFIQSRNYASSTDLAEKFSIGPKTAQRRLESLLEKGYIIKEGQGSGQNIDITIKKEKINNLDYGSRR
jgi:ATP-dependent DNA helicase RecG